METPAGWNTTDEGLVREYTFNDFGEAVRFITAVAAVAESLNHHPNIWNSYNKVRLTLFTHDAGAVTEKDRLLAREINAIG